MVIFVFSSHSSKVSNLNFGLLICVFALLTLITMPLNSRAETPTADLETALEGNIFKLAYPITRKLNERTKEYSRATLLRAETNMFLPKGDKLEFSGNLYALKLYDLFSPITSAVEFNKKVNIVGVGVTGTLKWSLFQHDNWGININGTISSGLNSRQQRNRWNFEHRIGWGANYKFNDLFQVSVGAYNYRIMDGFQSENPSQSYITSAGGFLTLGLQY